MSGSMGLVAALVVGLTQPVSADTAGPGSSPRTRTRLGVGWRFHLGNVPNPHSIALTRRSGPAPKLPIILA